MKDSVTVIVPTYNAGKDFIEFCKMLQKQTAHIRKVFVIDSSSKDDTVHIAENAGFTVQVIEKSDFGHGRTRQMGLETAKTDIVCFMTQDALLKEESSMEKLVDFLMQDDSLGAVYGRQLPYPHTGVLGAFARIYNYPEQSFVNTFEDRKCKGIKTAFLSDTFAAYRKEVLMKVGGFPLHSNFGEDSYVAAKMLMAGYKTGYCAEAAVYHAHDYTMRQEWERSKDISHFHKEEAWLLDTFGKPEGEGIRFVCKQIKWLFDNGYSWKVSEAILTNIVKYFGYKLGG